MKTALISFGATVLAVVVGIYVAPKIIGAVSK